MTGTSFKKVVVQTELLFEKRDDSAVFAAHLDALGLTAYGETAEAAAVNVKTLFHSWVTQCREHGILEARLTAIGAEWAYLDDYDGPEPVEEVGHIESPSVPPRTAEMPHKPSRYSLAMAA